MIGDVRSGETTCYSKVVTLSAHWDCSWDGIIGLGSATGLYVAFRKRSGSVALILRVLCGAIKYGGQIHFLLRLQSKSALSSPYSTEMGDWREASVVYKYSKHCIAWATEHGNSNRNVEKLRMVILSKRSIALATQKQSYIVMSVALLCWDYLQITQ